MNALRVSWLYLKVGVMNELQYRVNFFVQLLQSLIQVGTALVMLSRSGSRVAWAACSSTASG